MRNIIYASFHCSEPFFSKIFKDGKSRPGQEIQKYNRLLAEGFALSKENRVTAVSELPITEQNYGRKLFKRHRERYHEIDYIYLPLINIHRIKDLISVITSFLECLAVILRTSEQTVVSDVLNAPVALGSYLASVLFRRIKYIALVTDLPEYVYREKDHAYSMVSTFLLKRADSFVFLTEQMNTKVNTGNKPYVIIEGMVDYREKDRPCAKAENRGVRKIVYTGMLREKYGIGYLVEGFLKADIKDVELHIYGSGDMKEELERISKSHPGVVYHGNVLINEAVEAQRNADLLVNPRPAGEEYTKYSFPSKNMEYMVSGTPVLTTDLPGMPEAYKPYVFLLAEETAEGACSILKHIFSLDPEELAKKGLSAREFVLKEKTNAVQVERLCRELSL